ncbi:MAG: HYExAFE family protein [Phycisphaerae bacterium]
MADRSIHYEAAFEDYIRSKGWPYVAVDEARKAIFGGSTIKSFDFLVYSSSGPNLLVDVKGRKFPDCVPGRGRGASRAWENWVTREDIEGLREWQKVFGDDFTAVLVFAYWLQGPPGRSPFDDVHVFGDKHYAFVGIRLEEYMAAAKARSAKWGTLNVPSGRFAEMASDVAAFL